MGCSLTHRVKKHNHTAAITLPLSESSEEEEGNSAIYDTVRKSNLVDAVKDERGSFMADLQIDAIAIVSRTKLVPERMGQITIDFVISVPSTLQDGNWGVYFTPVISEDGIISSLDKIAIRGGLFSKLQSRQYWQFENHLNKIGNRSGYSKNSTYLASKYYEVLNELESNRKERLKRQHEQTIMFPQMTDARVDSVIHRGGENFNYYYTQVIKTNKSTKHLNLHFDGQLKAIDNSCINLPSSDTLKYIVSSMIGLIDTTKIYKTEVIEKFATVSESYNIQFQVGRSTIIDTLSNNRVELSKMEKMFKSLIYQNEFHVDSIILTSGGSPEGDIRYNQSLSKQRGKSIQQHLTKVINANIDTLITTNAIGEDWAKLTALIKRDTTIENRDEILDIIKRERVLDTREGLIRSKYPKDYELIKTNLYPPLRSVNFRYALRRVGMIKDTIHTNKLDSTYIKGIEYLKDREYEKALLILDPYDNQNTAITLLSLGYDKGAYDILKSLPQNALTNYLLAISCSRLKKYTQGKKYLERAIELNTMLRFRSNLDPEMKLLE